MPKHPQKTGHKSGDKKAKASKKKGEGQGKIPVLSKLLKGKV